jgi:hypothetical protein
MKKDIEKLKGKIIKHKTGLKEARRNISSKF